MNHGDDAQDPGPNRADDTEQEALRGALGPLFERARPPEKLRRQLRLEAEARFARAPRQAPVLRLLPRVAAITAACAAAGLAYVLITGRAAGPAGDMEIAERAAVPAGTPNTGTPNTGTPNTGDVDASGRVDIFDAYLVARALRDGDVSGMPDLDGDGRVTELDADLIAARAVELPR